MGVAVPQISFTSGEIAPSLYARVDAAAFRSGLRSAINMLVKPHGGIYNRSGFGHTSNSVGVTPYRLIPFKFNDEETYVIVLGTSKMRFVANGGWVVSATVNISSVTSADLAGVRTYTVNTAAVHGLSTGNTALLAGHSTGLRGLVEVTVSDTDTFTFTRTIATDGAPPVGTGGTVSILVEVASLPWSNTELADVRFTQSNDTMYLTHVGYQPQVLTRTSATAFALAAYANENGPFRDINSTTTALVYASAATGVGITLTSATNIFESGHIGGLFYMEEKSLRRIPPWEPSKVIAKAGYNPNGLLRRSDGKVYKCVTDITLGTSALPIITGTNRPVHETGVEQDGDGNSADTATYSRVGVDWEYQHAGFGIVQITAVGGPTSATATVISTLPDSVVGGTVAAQGPYTGTGDGVTTVFSIAGATSDDEARYDVFVDGVQLATSQYTCTGTTADQITFGVAPRNGTAIRVNQPATDYRTDIWAFGAWSTKYGFPSEVEFYGSRLVFAASLADPQSLWMTSIGDYTDFIQHLPIEDSDGIRATLDSKTANVITDLVPMGNLLALSKGGGWKLGAGQDDVLTPSTISAKRQVFHGVATLPALLADDTGLYVESGNYHVHDLGYQLESNTYTGNDISVTGHHLVENHSIIDWDYQAAPTRVVWAVRDDGVLLSLTYYRDHQVAGWCQHDIDGTVKAVCVIREDDEDAVYIIVERTTQAGTARFIERLSSRLYENVRDAMFVNAGLTYDGRNTAATTMTLSGSGWTVDDTLTLTSSLAGTFVAGDVGDWIVLNYEADADVGDGSALRLLITAYTSGTVVSVRPFRDVPASYQAVAFDEWAWARDVIYGFVHLPGEEVTVLADGSDAGEFTVDSECKITLTTPATVVNAGLGYNSDIETLDINVIGDRAVPFNTKLIKSMAVHVEATRGFFAGPNEDNLEEAIPRDNDSGYDVQTETTGVVVLDTSSAWNEGGRMLIRQSRPLPLTILSVTPDVTLGR